MATPLGLRRTTFDHLDAGVQRSMRTVSTALTAVFTTTASSISCTTNEIAFIDRIVIRMMTLDTGSANATVTLKINDQELPFHIPSVQDNRHMRERILNPKGNMVVLPGKALQAKANADTSASVCIYYRKYTLATARERGLITGTYPNVASTFSVSGAALVADTARKIVNCPAGSFIEILGFYLSGHNFNAAADSAALGFWDEVGTFYNPGTHTPAASASMVSVASAQGANPIYAPYIQIDDTHGCIQGPVGSSLYVQQTTNVVGANPNLAYVVTYRIVPAKSRTQNLQLATALTAAGTTAIVSSQPIPNILPRTGTVTITLNTGALLNVSYTSYTASTFTIPSTDFSVNQAAAGNKLSSSFSLTDVNDPTGKIDQNVTGARKWWVSTLAVPTNVFAPSTAVQSVFAAGAGSDMLVKVKGHVASMTCDAPAVFTATSQFAIGTSALAIFPILGNMPLDTNDLSGPNVFTSRTGVDPDEPAFCQLSQNPCLVVVASDGTSVASRFQCAWGFLSSAKTIAGISSVATP